MTPLQCAQCGQALALADQRCPRCGTPAPVEGRRALLQQRAEGLAEAGQSFAAAQALLAVLDTGPDPAAAKALWRRRAVWLQKSGDPRHLEQAEAALLAALKLDDNDDLSHQLWMDILKRRGSLAQADQWYKSRLQADPEDAVAKRHLAVLRLSAELLTAPKPGLDLGKLGQPSMLARLVMPNPYKVGVVSITLVASLGGLAWGLAHPAAPAAAASAAADPALADALSADGMGPILKLATDPGLNVLQAVLCAAYLWWAWKERRG